MTDQHHVMSTATEEQQGPPLPKWAYKIVNPAMAALLRSPLHNLISNSLMILVFEGRKTGKRYAIPVGYLQEGDRLYLFSHSAWSKNFLGGAPVAVRLRGKLARGTAQVIHDPAVIDKVVRRMVNERGEAMAQRMGFLTQGQDGTPQTQAPKGTTFIEIELQDAGA
jgi:hypothetical protein